MENKTKIYGAGDDLIEIEGQLSDEICCYNTRNSKKTITASDGTVAKIHYNNEGIWQIDMIKAGTKFIEKIFSVGYDNKHICFNAIGCSSYSDVLVLDEGIEWVKLVINNLAR